MAKDKGNRRLYRIGEAAALMKLKTCVLRFWEDEFPQLEPLRTPKGQRLYREEDMRVLRRIRSLLYDKGMTIEGARRVLAGGAMPSLRQARNAAEDLVSPTPVEALSAVLSATMSLPSGTPDAGASAGIPSEAVAADRGKDSDAEDISSALPPLAEPLSEPSPRLASRLLLPRAALPAFQASEYQRLLEETARELRELRSLLS